MQIRGRNIKVFQIGRRHHHIASRRFEITTDEVKGENDNVGLQSTIKMIKLIIITLLHIKADE